MSSVPRLERRPFARRAAWLTVTALIASTFVPTSTAVASDVIASTSASEMHVAATADAVVETPSLPVVSVVGTARVGVELTVDPGVWPDGVTLTYQWQVGGSDVAGATAETYTPGAGDPGKTVHVTVTGTRDGFPATVVVSAPTEPVDYGVLTPSGRPVISGTVQVDSVVTASAVRWSPAAIGSYSWRIDGEYVPGALRTYRIRPEDAGKVLTVSFSGLLAGYRITSVRSDPVVVAYGDLAAPVPTIIGTAGIDEVLTVQTGAWTQGTRLTYQWSVGGEPVDGATGTTYTVRHADADRRITVTVSGSKLGYTPTTVVSDPTDTVGYGTLIAPKPTISGAVRVGATLSAQVGTWTDGTALSYQWLLDDRPVAGATGKKMTLQPSDRGKRVTFSVTGSLWGHKTTRVVSARSTAVAAGKLATSVPLISGKAKHGVTLVAKPGKWSDGTSLSYRWYVDRKLVAGATSKSFTLARAHIGKSVLVKVTGRKKGYASVTKTSAATKPVVKKSVFRLTIVDIIGTPRVGRELIVSTSLWVPEIRYQWYVGGRAVSGATTDTFVPRAADRGKAVTCKVTIRKPGYVTATMTSDRTAAVR
jgi:hypothetical protein